MWGIPSHSWQESDSRGRQALPSQRLVLHCHETLLQLWALQGLVMQFVSCVEWFIAVQKPGATKAGVQGCSQEHGWGLSCPGRLLEGSVSPHWPEVLSSLVDIYSAVLQQRLVDGRCMRVFLERSLQTIPKCSGPNLSC